MALENYTIWIEDGRIVRGVGAMDSDVLRLEAAGFEIITKQEFMAAIKAEREACAKIAEDRAAEGELGTWQAQEGLIIAAAIRNR